MKQEKERKQIRIVVSIILVLVGVLITGLVVAGMMAGWFDDPKVVIDQEYHSDTPKFIDLDAAGYENLIKDKKSFIVLVDQNGCVTADRIRGYMADYMKKRGIDVYRMMFKEVKESSLNDFVKYYPSVVIVNRGKVRTYLKADSDEDVEKYNNYTEFEKSLDSPLGRY